MEAGTHVYIPKSTQSHGPGALSFDPRDFRWRAPHKQASRQIREEPAVKTREEGKEHGN